MKEATATQIARARMHSLLLASRQARTCAEVATWFGALQAQDLASGKWSLGVRMKGSSEKDVDDALERGEVLRTWPMRGTIHIVASEDVRWMLELTGVRAIDSSLARRQQLGLDLTIVDRAADLLEDALRGGRRLTRGEALAMLDAEGISTVDQRGYHLLWFAAQTGRICIGPQSGKQQTFVRLEDWAPHQRQLDRRSALTELAYRFFRSHGPAPDRDFAGWSGLTLTDARAGLAANDGRLVPVSYRGDTVWASAEVGALLADGGLSRRAPTVALPGFDEFILGYKDRHIQAPVEHMQQIVPGNNGMFRATLTADGRVVGTWQRKIGRSRVTVAVEPFAALSSSARSDAARALGYYGDFLGLPVVLA